MPYNLQMDAFIPIKSHSERVPGKNFRNLDGKPLYLWVIESLLRVSEISKIIIDTDSDDANLWNLANQPRIVFKIRNPKLVGDFTSMNELLLDSLDIITTQDVLMTHVTNPFLAPSTIQNAILKYRETKSSGFDSLFSVSRIQGRIFDLNGVALNHDQNNLIRTQDLDPIYLENSCLYIFSKESLLMSGGRIGKTPLMHETPTLESIDIDTEDDWKIAAGIAQVFGLGSSE